VYKRQSPAPSIRWFWQSSKHDAGLSKKRFATCLAWIKAQGTKKPPVRVAFFIVDPKTL